MKIFLFIFLIFTFTSANADNEYCQKSTDNQTGLTTGYSAKFCFGSEDFMDEFEQVLVEDKISHVRYPDGSIGYKSTDKEQVQLLGDKLVHDYLTNQGRFGE